MISTIKRYIALLAMLLLIVGAFFLYYSGFKRGAEKWKTIANQQKAKADSIKTEQQNAKEANEIATEYEKEQLDKAREQINEDGHTDTIGAGINDWD